MWEIFKYHNEFSSEVIKYHEGDLEVPNEIMDRIERLERKNLRPQYIIMGLDMYKRLIAAESFLRNGLVKPLKFHGLPIVVVQDKGYMRISCGIEQEFVRPEIMQS